MTKRLSLIFSSLLFLSFILSCGKTPQQLPLSFIRIQIPQSHEQLHDDYQKLYASADSNDSSNYKRSTSTPQITFIMINVSGAGMARMTWNWEACQGSNCSAASQIAPSYVDLQVPGGSSSRRFQVIVGKESTSSSETISSSTASESNDGGKIYLYYGQSDAILNGSTMNISLTAAPIEAGGSDPSEVVGRYLTGVDLGPSDILDIYFLPPGDSVPMLIESTQMFNGWFKGFTLNNSSTQFVYRLRSNPSQVLMTFPQDLNNTLASTAASEHLIKINTPNSYYTWFDSSVGVSLQKYSSRGNNLSTYYGFFGTNTSSKLVCYNSATAANVSYNIDSLGYPQGLVINSSGTNIPLLWYSDKVGNYSSHMYRDAGGVAAASNSPCGSFSSNQEYIDYIRYNYQQASGSSGAAIGVNPPYKIPALNGETGWANIASGVTVNNNFFLYKTASASGGLDVVVKYAYLNGISNYGTAFYFKPNATQADSQLLDNNSKTETRCAKALSLGWSSLHQAYVATTATVTISGAYPTGFTSSPRFAVCPYATTITPATASSAAITSTVYYDADIWFEPYYSSNSSVSCSGVTLPVVDNTSDFQDVNYTNAYCILNGNIGSHLDNTGGGVTNTLDFNANYVPAYTNQPRYKSHVYVVKDPSVSPPDYYQVILRIYRTSTPSNFDHIDVYHLNNGGTSTYVGGLTPAVNQCYKLSNLTSISDTGSGGFGSSCPPTYQLHTDTSITANPSPFGVRFENVYYSKISNSSSDDFGTPEYP